MLRRVAPLLIASFGAKLLVLAILYPLDPSRIVAGDTASYENPAHVLLSSGQFSSSLEEPSRVETLRTPGYPSFLAAVFVVSRNSRLAVAIAQIAISTLTLAVIAVLATRLWGPPTAFAATAFLALDLLSFVYAPMLQTETLFALAIALTALAGVMLLRAPAVRWALLFGCAAAAATLIRPIAYYLFVPSLAAILMHGVSARVAARRLAAIVLVAALPWIVLVEGWKLRNYVMTGRAEISQIAAVNLLWYRGAGVIAARDHISFWEARDQIERSLPDTSGWSPGAISALYQREGLRLIRGYPMLFLHDELYGLLKVIAGPGRSDLLHYLFGTPYEDTPSDTVGLSASSLPQRFAADRPIALAPLVYATAYLGALYVCVLFGLREVLRHERHLWAAHAFVWWLIVYLVVLAAGPEAYARFRVPVMPLLALYAGRGVSSLVTFARTRQLS